MAQVVFDDLRVLPTDVIAEIFLLADNPKYQHGFGCRCAPKNCPGEGIPISFRIGRELGIDNHTVKMYLTPEFREKRAADNREWLSSLEGAEARREYRESPEGQAAQKRYEDSEKGAEAGRRSTARYRQTDKGEKYKKIEIVRQRERRKQRESLE